MSDLGGHSPGVSEGRKTLKRMRSLWSLTEGRTGGRAHRGFSPAERCIWPFGLYHMDLNLQGMERNMKEAHRKNYEESLVIAFLPGDICLLFFF